MDRRSWDGCFQALPTTSDGSGEECVEDEDQSRRVVVCRSLARPRRRRVCAIRNIGAAVAIVLCLAVAAAVRYAPDKSLLRAVWGRGSKSITFIGDAGDNQAQVLDPGAWNFYGGHSCDSTHGGQALSGHAKLKNLTIVECTSKCQADPSCAGVATEHNKKRGLCRLLSKATPKECAQSSSFDLWQRADFKPPASNATSTSTTAKAAAKASDAASTSAKATKAEATTTSSQHRPPPEWTTNEGYNCFVGHGALPVTDEQVPLPGVVSLGDCQKNCESDASCMGFVVKHGNTDGGCWMHAHIELSSCVTGTEYDTWIAKPASQQETTSEKPANAKHEKQGDLEVEAKSTDPSKGDKTQHKGTQGWSARTGLNCFQGHGAHHLQSTKQGEQEPEALQLSLDDCKAECEQHESCSGVVVHPIANLCWPSSDVKPDECLTGTVFDLWIRPHRAGGGDAHDSKEGDTSAMIHTPAPPSPSPASKSSSSTKMVWLSYEGLNCFIGAGSSPFTDGSDGTLQGSFSLPDCQAECRKTPDCDGVIVRHGQQADVADACFLRAKVQPANCAVSAEYDLWQLSSGDANSDSKAQKSNDDEAERGAAFDPADPASPKPAPGKPPPQTEAEADGKCPACSPRSSGRPAVVIPFYERDLCKATYTAASLALHDKDRALGDVLLLWISKHPSTEYDKKIQAIKESLAKTHKVELLDMSSEVNDNHKDGWYAQQVFKLKAASHLKSEFYIVLDSKNTFMQDVDSQTFFTECNQARLLGTYPWGQLPKCHQEWFKRSVEVLKVPEPIGGEWPASITPMIMHRQTVLDMLNEIGETPTVDKLCEGPLCKMLDEGATEFTLYLMYAQSKPDFECLHAVSHAPDWAHELAVSMWRGLESNVEEAKNVATGQRFPILFGAQHGALESVTDEQFKEVTGYLKKIYEDAGLHGVMKEGKEDFVDCVVGSD